MGAEMHPGLCKPQLTVTFPWGTLQMVVLMDPMEDPDDILRAHRSREKSYLFDVAFDFTATQVGQGLDLGLKYERAP